MDGDAPVLTNRKEIKLWKRLKALESSAAKGSKKDVEKLNRIIQGILDTEGYANPKIIVKVIELIDIYLSDVKVMLEILEKCKLTDCAPQLLVAEKLVKVNLYDSAKLILDRMTVISDVPTWEYLRGRIDLNEGDEDSAYKHFVRVYEYDDTFVEVYPYINQMEPEKGWFYRGLIASLRLGENNFSMAGSVDGRFGELYNAYQAWYNGGRANVVDSVSRIVREGIGTDVELALARFNFDEGKYFESVEHYQKAAESGIYFIKMELAEAYLKSGALDSALGVCNELDALNISDRRLINLQLRIATALKNRADVVKYVKIYLYNDYADYNAYVDCVNAYTSLRMHSEASSLLEDMSMMDSDDPMINLLSSKNDYASGRYPAARVTAKKAVRKMPNDQDCLLHITRVYMSMKRSEKALKYVDMILKENDRNKEALLLKKDIYMSMMPPDYEAACRQCEKIIAHSDDDSETWKDYAILLSKMGRDRESLDAYERSLKIKVNPILFMDIIVSMARAGKHEDVVYLTNKYDNDYGGNVDMWAIKGNSEYQIGDYEGAIASYTRAVEMDTNNPVFWHSKGMAEEMAGKYTLAEVSYDKAVLMDLDNPEYWISKAAVQEKKGDYPGAVNSLNRVISTHPENVYSLMKKAMILVRLGKNSEARTFIELASKIDPINMKIMLARRDIYYREGDTESTKAVCKNILSITPRDKKTAIILAHMHMKTGELDEARTVLVAFSVDDDVGFIDEDYDILNMLREIYHTQGKTHEEISTCKTILSFKPDDRDTKAALAEAYIKRGMIDAAKALYDELHLQSPEDSDYSLKKAKMAEDKDAALAVLMESLTKDPDSKEVLLEVARILFDDGKPHEDGKLYENGKPYDDRKLKDALIYVNRAINADPTDSAPYLLKMLIFTILGNHRGVLDVGEEASSNVRIKDPMIFKYSGDSLMILGEYSKALIMYDTAMKLGLSIRDIYHARGMCQEALEMYEAAINSYTIAYQKDPEDTDSMIRVADIHLRLERDQSAGRVLDQAISAKPLCTVAIIARATIFASKGNETGVKRLFDHCISYNVDEETKQIVAELMDKARTKEVVAMPRMPLVMPTPSISEYEEEEEPEEPEGPDDEEPPEDEEPPGEEGPQHLTDDTFQGSESEESSEEASDVDELSEEEIQETEQSVEQESSEEPVEDEPAEEEPTVEEPAEEELEDGFFVVSSDDEEESVEEGSEDESEVVVEEPAEEKPIEEEPEQPAEEQTPEVEDKGPPEERSDDDSNVEEQPTTVEEEPVDVPEEKPAEESEDEVDFVIGDEPEEEPIQSVTEEPVGPVAEEPPEVRKTVKEYALDFLQAAKDTDEDQDHDKIMEEADIPSDMRKPVMDYLSDIDEYGKINPKGSDFHLMEKMSYDVITKTKADDIEEDHVIPLASAFFYSGTKEIDVAKRLVAYIYEAMTCEIDANAVYDNINDVVDDVEFNGGPSKVYDIMSQYRIGVYSARAVKDLVFNKDDQ